MNYYIYDNISPKFNSSNIFIADGARVIGNIELGDFVSIWYNAVLRGDVGKIIIGSYTNIQDNSIIHMLEEGEVNIGEYVTIGHGVNLHNVRIGNNCLIGNGAILLDEVEIGDNTIIAAGTVIPPRKKIPSGVLVLGNPYKILRDLTEEDLKSIKNNALLYWELAQKHKNNIKVTYER